MPLDLPTTTPRPPRVLWPLVGLFAAWATLFVVHYFQVLLWGWTAWRTIVWFSVVAATIAAGLQVWRRARWRGIVYLAVLSALLTTGALLPNWPHTYAVTYFDLHSDTFNNLALWQEEHHLEAADDYKCAGVSLPPEFQELSEYGCLEPIGRHGDDRVWLVPVRTTADETCGYAYIPGKVDPSTTFDFDGAIHPVIDLGAGWWWIA
ncbi:hypothetical protein [Actinokineospora enzanensis]|uniref:hypothetical protein n=1 Tax=Actinokineospora enzanensis TaxID=155975 RepID=UPI0003647EEF|nr:hypothetical protein [Actinokineospora enzanensis]